MRLTFEFDVTMNETDGVHPTDGFAQLAKHSSEKAVIYLGVAFGRVDQIKQFSAADVFEHKAVVRWGAERMKVRHDRCMRDMLKRKLEDRARGRIEV